MSNDDRDPIQISEAELRAMTADLEDMHQATLPSMHEHVAEFSANLASRRGFLLGSGVMIGGLALAACGTSNDTPAASSTTAAASQYTGDLKVVALAAALENLAVAAYTGALDAAGKGAFGTVPPAVATFATTVRKQHEDHASAWNLVLKGAGLAPITGAPLSITAEITAQLAGITDVAGVAKLALSLEDVAAATYLSGLGAITDPGGIKTAATILPVETQHAAILHFVLGQYPVPLTFRTTAGAVGVEALIA